MKKTTRLLPILLAVILVVAVVVAACDKAATVSFLGGTGATGSVDAIETSVGEEITLPQNGFTKAGHTFAGWTLDGKVYQPGDKYEVAGDVTFTAKWNVVTPETHECEHECDICHKCKDPDCNDSVCAEKCNGHQTETKYAVTVSAEHATVTAEDGSALAGEYAENTVVKFKVVAASGYNIVEVKVNDVAVSATGGVYSFTITKASSIAVTVEAADGRSYFLVGSGNGSIKDNGWKLDTGTLNFVRTPGTNVYTLSNVALVAYDEIKLGFNTGAWDDGKGGQYTYGAYFFKGSDVFVSSDAWTGNATVAEGKSGVYNITLVTTGANTATTAVGEGQIVSITLECVTLYDETVKVSQSFLTGSMNNWSDQPTAWPLEESDNTDIWTGIYTIAGSGEIKLKAIQIIEIKVDKGNSDVVTMYKTLWCNDPDTAISANARYQFNYNVSTNVLSAVAIYSVSYDIGDHAATSAVNPDGGYYKANDPVVVADAIAAAEGWVFAGWSDGAEVYQAGASYTMPAKDVTFTAAWTQVIDIANIVGVYTSEAGEAIISTINPMDGSVGSILINNTLESLFYNDDHTDLHRGDYEISKTGDNTLNISGVTYTFSRAISNAALSTFKGDWQMVDSSFTVSITDNSVSYTGTHYIIDKYLVLYNSSADYYILYMNDDALVGHYNGAEVSFTQEVTTIDIDKIVGVWKKDGGDTLIYVVNKAIEIQLSGKLYVGSIVINNVFTSLYYSDDQTTLISYQDYYDLTIKKDGSKLKIGDDTYSYNGEIADTNLSTFEGRWVCEKYSIDLTITSNSLTAKSGVAQHTIVGDYLVVYYGNLYYVLEKQDETIVGYRHGRFNTHDEVTFEPFTDDCAWADYLGAWVDEDDTYGVLVMRNGLLVTLGDTTMYIPAEDFIFDDGDFMFNVDGIDWYMSYISAKGWFNLYDDDSDIFDDNIYRSKNTSIIPFMGMYAGTIYAWEYDDGDYYPDYDQPEHEVVIVVTATGDIIVLLDGEKAVVTDIEPWSSGVDLTINGVCYCLYKRTGADWTDDDGFAKKLELQKYDSEDYNGSSYEVGTLNSTDDVNLSGEAICQWEEYIGTYVYYEEGNIYTIILTKSGVQIIHNGVPFEVSIVEYDNGDFDLLLNGEIECLLWMSSDEANLMIDDYDFDEYAVRCTWENLLGTYTGTIDGKNYVVTVEAYGLVVSIDGDSKVGADSDYIEAGPSPKNNPTSFYMDVKVGGTWYGIIVSYSDYEAGTITQIEFYKYTSYDDGEKALVGNLTRAD